MIRGQLTPVCACDTAHWTSPRRLRIQDFFLELLPSLPQNLLFQHSRRETQAIPQGNRKQPSLHPFATYAEMDQ